MQLANCCYVLKSVPLPCNKGKRVRDASIHTSKNIAQVFILERYFFVSICPAANPGTYLMVFLVVTLLLCLLHQIYIQRS